MHRTRLDPFPPIPGAPLSRRALLRRAAGGGAAALVGTAQLGCHRTAAQDATPVSSSGSADTEILWDTWGVPHIFADDAAGLFYAFGWAQTHSHGDLLLRLYGQARGRAAEYWGERYLESDRWLRTDGHSGPGRRVVRGAEPGRSAPTSTPSPPGSTPTPGSTRSGSPTRSEAVLPGQRPRTCSPTPLRFWLFFLWAGEQAPAWFRLSGSAPVRRAAPTAGRSRRRARPSGHALLLANPHLFWAEFIFFEAQLAAPGYDAYGATLVGMPVLGIAFNDALGWTHTVNTFDGWDVYALTPADGGYRFDGEVRALRDRDRRRSRSGRRTAPLREEDARRAPLGPRPDRRRAGRPADRAPGGRRRPAGSRPPACWSSGGTWAGPGAWPSSRPRCGACSCRCSPCSTPTGTGTSSACSTARCRSAPSGDWDVLGGARPRRHLGHALDRDPPLRRPAAGGRPAGRLGAERQRAALDGDPPLPAPTRRTSRRTWRRRLGFPGFRAQRGDADADRGPSDDVGRTGRRTRYSTRVEFADRILDDLIAAARQHGGAMAQRAADVLAAWDRRVDADSRGALLFVAWVQARARQADSTPRASSPPRGAPRRRSTTPRGLADPAAAVALLDGGGRAGRGRLRGAGRGLGRRRPPAAAARSTCRPAAARATPSASFGSSTSPRRRTGAWSSVCRRHLRRGRRVRRPGHGRGC